MAAYNTPNSQHTFTVPSGASGLEIVDCIGGDGGQGGVGDFGNNPGGDGGSAGQVQGRLVASPGDTFTVNVGEDGEDGTTGSGGSAGGQSPNNSGGSGGGGHDGGTGEGGGGGAESSVVRDSDSATLAVGEGGGGGEGGHDQSEDAGGGGGGGARGGLGGDGGFNDDGGDATGTGNGGDGGGDGSGSPAQDGSDGGTQTHGDLQAVSTSTSTSGPLVEIVAGYPPAAPQNLSVDAARDAEIDISWTDDDSQSDTSTEDGFRVYKDDGSGETQVADLAAGTESYTITGLLHGEQYDIRVEAYNTFGTADSTVTGTTTIPDAPTPPLDNTVEDEITATWSWTNNGDVRAQVRKTGESAWDGSATGFGETVDPHTAGESTLGGLSDGIEYEVRIRGETPHRTGAWSSPTATITKFPAPTNLSVDDRFGTVQLSYTDNADNEESIVLQRTPSGQGNWSAVQTAVRQDHEAIDAITDDYAGSTGSWAVASDSSLEGTQLVESTGQHAPIGNTSITMPRGQTYRVQAIPQGPLLVLFGSQDPANALDDCYAVRLNPPANTWEMQLWQGGAFQGAIASGSATIASGTAYTVEIGYGQPTLDVRLLDSGGSEIATLTVDDTTHSGGTFGFYSDSTAGDKVDAFAEAIEDTERDYFIEFDYRIRQFTDDSTATSNVVTTTPQPGQSDPRISATGWTVVVTHPVTGRFFQPEILDQPTFLPSLNSLPRIRIPVRRNDAWLQPEMDANPTMDVWFGGTKLPIDELREINHRPDRTILTGKGGIELEKRVRDEFRTERRHIAATDLITTNTSYAEDVDTPVVDSVDDQLQQSPTTTTDFENLLNILDSDPLEISGDQVDLLQTCWVATTEDYAISGGTFTSGSQYESGTADILTSTSDTIDFQFTVDYDITTNEVAGNQIDEFRPALRTAAETGGSTSARIFLDVDSTGSFDLISSQGVGNNTVEWQEFPTSQSVGELTAGTHTIRIKKGSSGSDGLVVDVAAVFDRGERYGGFTYTFDNSLHTSGGHLDGPENYPLEYPVESEDSLIPFAVTGARADLSISDTSNGQSLQVSNDRGANWYPDNGSEDNTTSVDVTFPSFGATLRLRAMLSRHSPSGAQDDTPRFGYAGQSISAWDLYADLDLEALLFDQAFDTSLESILTDIASENYLWSVNLDDAGNYQVSWTQPGSRTGDRDPDVEAIQLPKNIATWEKVTVKGASRRIADEPWTAATTFTSLDEAGTIVVGSETVYDSTTGQTFERGTDYEVDYQAGDIRAIDSVALTMGSSYSVDYAVETVGSYTVPSAGANPREFVANIPAVSSPAGCESIAFILAEKFAEPRWAGNVTLAREQLIDPLNALALATSDLPDAATPLEPQSQPEITPSGITLRLGSRGQLDDAASAITSRLQQISRQS